MQAYVRALVYVADTVNIIFAKFAWTIIDIEFLQSTFKSRKSLGDLRLKPSRWFKSK